MQISLLHRLHQFITPTAEETGVFQRLASRNMRLSRHGIIRSQGDPVESIYFLTEGWVAACVRLPNQRNQVIKVHLPGDLLGTPSLVLSNAAESLVALTNTNVAVIPAERFGRMFEEAPRLGAAMFLAAQQERVALMDRIASIGQTNALQRLSAFLLDIHCRLKLVDPAIDGAFGFPLSQKQVGDVIGLTPVHVNRTFKQMRQDGLIERKGRFLQLLDKEKLRDLGGLGERTFVYQPSWLFPNGFRRTT